MESFVLFSVGIIFGFTLKNYFEKIVFKETEEKDKTEREEKILLRNGLGITRENDPTIAEQLVNIMNYNGESQTEENE